MSKNKLLYSILLTFICSMVVMADNYIVINQVMYDTPLNEMTNISPSSNGEFIELYNAGSNPVSLQGWKLTGDGTSENFVFIDDIIIPIGGYVIVACKRGAQNSFTLSDLYSTSQLGENKTIIYQNKVILANDGETITLYNTVNDIVDQMYYDGTSHKTNPNRLYAENEDGISGEQCISLHRTWVEFDNNGKIVPGTSQWKADSVSFSSTMLTHSTYKENYLFETNSLPTGENYVLSITPLDPTSRIDISEGQVSACSGVRLNTTLTYIDGIGRQEQSIALYASPEKQDIVSLVEYNDVNNISKQWLPIVTETGGQRINQSEIISQAQADYNDKRPFEEVLYEISPKKRVVKSYRPGENYRSNAATITYEFNNDVDQVLIYTVINDSTLKTTGECYTPQTLYKTQTIDEDKKSIITYTNKSGQIVMEDRGGSKIYYVYDNMKRLRYMLPQIATSKLSNGEYNPNHEVIQASAYYYQYDERGNMIYKRLPGCAPQYMVYDQLGQLVLKQDGNQRKNNKWTLCAYDSVGRNIYIAELPLTQKHDYLINLFADKWQVEHYGNNPSNVSIAGTGYASTILGKNDLQLLIVNYYDNYDYLSRISTNDRQALHYSQESGYGLLYDNSIGLLTGTRVYNLSESGYTVTAYYYDAKGQTIQSRNIRSNGQLGITNTQYHFNGSIAQQLTMLEKDSAFFREHYCYTYDHTGRAQNVYYQLNNEEKVLLSSFSYDKTGRLVQNLLHEGKDTIKYSHDMRGMLKRIQNKHFSEELFYADNTSPFVDACYNGNIAATHLTLADTTFTFSYSYDEQNRLVSSSQLCDNAQLLSEYFSYDPSGNILGLKRYKDNLLIDDLILSYGNDGNQLLSITDNGHDANMYSTLEYHNADMQADTTMRYDANGNLIYDADRGISVIRYNILNLPDTIQFANGNQIVNLYNAAGQKYKSIIYTNLETATTPYQDIAHYTYETETAEFVATEYIHNIEIFYTKTDTTIQRINNTIGYYADSKYYHYIKDHLGNICAVVDSENDSLVQSTLYYASGVPMSQSSGRDKQSYLYNSKEFVEAHGYNTYDYGFRGYYAPIGRFTSIDPLAEQTPWLSPYAYAGNNFSNCIDWMGLSGITSMSHDGNICQYIVIDENGDYLGGVDDGNITIYMDPDGKWEEQDGTVGLEPVGWTLFSVSYYDLFVGKGNPAPGLYYGQWSISVAGLFGIFLDVDLVKKIKINLSAGIDLWKVSYNGEFDFSEIRNGKHNGMLGGGVKYKDYGLYFQESFKVYSGSMEYVPGSTTYSGGLLFSHASGTGWDGNITLSAALSAVLGLSVTFSINIYYQGQ